MEYRPGCSRTLDEIAAWSQMDDFEKEPRQLPKLDEFRRTIMA